MNEAEIEKLKKYKGPMDRLYFVLLACNIIIEFFKTTQVIAKLYALEVYGLSLIDPDMPVALAKLIFNLITSFPLLIAIPAIYVILVEMKTKKERIIGIFFLLIGWLYSLTMREWNDVFMFRTLLIIVASYGKDFKKIARLSITVIISCIFTTMILSMAGLITEYNYERNGMIRHSFGLNGPVALAAHISMTIITIIFLRNGLLKWYDYITIALMIFFNVACIDGRASLLTMILAFGGAVVYGIVNYKSWKIPEIVNKLVQRILAYSFLIIAAIYFFMTLTYRGDRDSFYRHIPFLSTFEGRIAVPHRLIGELGISLFGNYLERYYAMEHAITVTGEYNFIDSSYARMLVIYGVVGLVLSLWIFTKAQRRLMKNGQTFRMYLLAVLALNYVVERFLMDPMYNVFMLLFFAVIPTVESEALEREQRRAIKPIYVGERDSEGKLRQAYTGIDIREVYQKKPALYKLIKRVGDIVGSVCALIIFSPVFLVTAIAIKLEDGGPVFFSGKRYGKDLKYFPMYKFRSMCIDAEKKTKEVLGEADKNGLAFKIKDDPRITKTGKFIRRTSIDELPQFWNVLKGEMSLVGPRPIQTTDKEIEEYEKQRWTVKPGITCIWQVCGRAEVPWDEWVEMDLKYISEMSVWTDIRLMWETLGAILKKDGAM